MNVLGIVVAKGNFRYALLTGTKQKPDLVEKGRFVTPDPEDVPALMNWYESQFGQLIARLTPDRVAYRLPLDPNKEQLFTSEFPLGILNLLAFQKELPITPYSPQSFVPSKLHLPKSTDLYVTCDHTFGIQSPYWDNPQKHAILVAWFEL